MGRKVGLLFELFPEYIFALSLVPDFFRVRDDGIHFPSNYLPMFHFALKLYLLLYACIYLCGCRSKGDSVNTDIDDIAYDDKVAEQLKRFEGKGILSDESKPMDPLESLDAFQLPNDLTVELILAEPDISQPVFIDFDYKGRLWVVQYRQYPYPKGLKVKGVDEYLRMDFDNIPLPPPSGVKGADKISMFEDTDKDGKFDKKIDVITGLNIVTSVALGRGKIWVLNPPYLLAYPDEDNNGIVDGKPKVHLKGFGFEDTHAVANSLRWGPDGWLYGAQGSTNSSSVSSAVSKEVKLMGQGIWRYNPETMVFEVYAEGGGNTFYIEFDDKGRLFSGDNALSRGQYYKQGGYFNRNFDKHGPFSNAYTFGYLRNMNNRGDRARFTHAWIKYEGGNLPQRYLGKMMALNPLLGYIQLSRLENNGSTFRTVDENRILETNDKWFRPVDIKVGPDGAVYIADWYDSRLSHVDPRDTWHKSSGRIYRIRGKSHAMRNTSDLSKVPSLKLAELLSHSNKWYRQQALRVLGDRRDESIIPFLVQNFRKKHGQLALESLWALYLSGGFKDSVISTGMEHPDPFVRMWTVRLSTDKGQVSNEQAARLVLLAERETHAEVRSQLASSAKRLPLFQAIPIIRNLLYYQDDSKDPDIPLLIWWAVESKALSGQKELLGIFSEPILSNKEILKDFLAERLMKRYVMDNSPSNSRAAVLLVEKAASKSMVKAYIKGLQQGLEGNEHYKISPELLNALRPHRSDFREQLLSLAVRSGDNVALQEVLTIIEDNKAKLSDRISYTKLMGDITRPQSIPVLTRLLISGATPDTILHLALQTLPRYDDPEIGRQVLKIYLSGMRQSEKLQAAALSLLVSRPIWARQFLSAIETSDFDRKNKVPIQIIRRLELLNDSTINHKVKILWPQASFTSTVERSEQVKQVIKMLRKGKGDPVKGKTVFVNRCGNCHRLFNEGGVLGPDLTGYDRRNVSDMLMNIIDPSADIREGYVYYQVNSKDGRSLYGKIIDRSGDNITLVSMAGEKTVLAKSAIVKMEAQPTSLMPERLLDGLSEQEMQDLFSYIMK